MFNFDRRFFGASEKMDGHFSKKHICLLFSNFKKSYLFNFDRRFFGASEKMDGHFLKKLICYFDRHFLGASQKKEEKKAHFSSLIILNF